MIPQEKSAAVIRGLREAFGATEIEDICRMTKGLSSDLVFRIVVLGRPYLLRVMARMDERKDPVRIFACTRAAAEAGLAPRVWYANEEDGVAIFDFVDEVRLPLTQALDRLPGVLRRLHALPRFPKEFNYVTAHDGFIWRFRKAGLLPEGEVAEVFGRYEQVCAVYPRLAADMVSCHMDLKPENILFDGERVWLVDWEAGFVNDRYFDLAVVANFLVTDDADEWGYLERYFGRRPDAYERARFFLMRQVLHVFAAAIFLLFGAAGRPVRRNGSLPSFGEFHRRVWAGEVDLADDELKVVYGLVHWARVLENVRGARFEEALGLVAERNAGAGGVELLLPGAPPRG